MTSKVEIKQFEFNKTGLKELEQESFSSKLKWASNWPTIYIINNSKEAYIGESYKIKKRLSQHLCNEDRRTLNKINILVDEKSNKSYTLDIESTLIRYMSADETFDIQNGNHGLVNYNYYNKESYHLKFKKEIWLELKKLGLVRKDLNEIENSDLFKFSPYTSLNSEQMNVVEDILGVFNINTPSKGNILINGGPGTGKTLLAVYLIKLLNLTDKNFEDEEVKYKYTNIQNVVEKVGLVIPQSSLRKTLKKVFGKIKGLNSNMVLSPHDVLKDEYDLLIVDEAHRLRRRRNLSNYGSYDENNRRHGFSKEATELDWILSKSRYQILFYDPNQTIKPTDLDNTVIRDKLIEDRLTSFNLQSQFRVKAGDDYIKYVKDLLNCKLEEKKNFSDYDLKLFDSLKEMYKEIKLRNKEFDLSRLVAGYGWKWVSKKNKDLYDIELDGLKLQWNNHLVDWVNRENSINEVGCIHTIQGYDLNYTGVIFGPEITYDEKQDKIKIIKENYYDMNGKAGIKTEKELENYIKNIYFVLMTRGIKGTYVYVCDEKLRKYLKRFI